MTSVRSTPPAMALLTVLLGVTYATPVHAMGRESFGPAGEHISRSQDWPRGIEDVLRHPSRVYWQWVNGNEHAYYDGDIQAINELLALFGQVDLQVHQVLIRPGRPTARSFEGLQVEHNVEFEVVGGIALHRFRELAGTGLYSVIPRMTIYIDEKLMRQLDQLKFPADAELRALPFRVEDALAGLTREDRSLRGRAITLLGASGDRSESVVNALKQAVSETDEYISGLAKDALRSIEKANVDSQRALREHIAGYLRNHPQRWHVPSADELLKTLRRTDNKYARGFTARGTTVEPMSSGRRQPVAWTVTMGEHRLVLQRTAVEDEDHPARENLLENTIYTGPERMGTIHRYRLWIEGDLVDTKPHATFEPVGSTYDLLIGRMLWPLGRGLTRRIDKVTRVALRPDGLLEVKAESNQTGLPMRWELQIDPRADYLVRRAIAYRGDADEPMYGVENSGVQTAGDRTVAHTASWTEGRWGEPISIAVHSVSAEPDMDLIRETAKRLTELK